MAEEKKSDTKKGAALIKRIKDEYFADWKADRSDLETTWSMSYDAFRGDYSSHNLAKWKALEGTDWRSKVFVRLTKMKVVSAVSQIEDIYFQGGKIPFNIEPTPYPEDMQMQTLPPEIMKQRSSAMQKRIDDIFVESKMQRLQMNAILEMAIYGMSVLKAPVIRSQKKINYKLDVPLIAQYADMMLGTNMATKYGRYVMMMEDKLIAQIEHPNLWDIFWDMEGEDFQTNQGVIHRAMLSPGQLYSLANLYGNYDVAAIKRVMAKGKATEGTTVVSDSSESPARQKLLKKKRGIQTLLFYGRVPLKDLRDTQLWDTKDDGREVEICCTIADDEIIRQPIINPIPGKIRPYFAAKWEEIPHEAQGIGIPENMKDSQMMVNSGVRCFIDNKALSGNVLMAGNLRNLAPGQNKSVYPGKFFEIAEHVQDARQALQFFSPPDIGQGMLDLVNLFERFADEESQLPKLLSGEKSVGDPKTAFAFSRLVENANKAIGKVIRNIDEGQTEPIVTTLYHWLMATDQDENIKGDYTCNATGFGGYTDRVMQGENLQNFFMFVLSNTILTEFAKPLPWLREIAKKRGLDPDQILLTDTELQVEIEKKAQAMLSQVQPPPGVAPLPGQEVPGAMPGQSDQGGMIQ